MMKKIVSIWVLGLVSVGVLLGALSYLDRSYIDHQNLLTNPGFESGKAAWTVSGGTYSNDNTNVHEGSQSAQVSVSSGTACIQQDVTPIVQTGSQNLEYSAWVKTAATDVQICARQSGSTVGNCTYVPGTNTWVQGVVNYPGPVSGSVGVSVCNTSSNTELFNVDSSYVGTARNLSQVSQSLLLGGVVISGCTTNPNNTATSVYTSLTGSGCTFVPFGQVVVSGTQTVSLKLPSGAPGEYRLELEGNFGNSINTDYTVFQATDGTNISREVDAIAGTGSAGSNSMAQTIPEIGALTNTVFEYKAKSQTGSAVVIAGTTAGFSVSSVLRLYYSPSQSQVSASISQTDFGWTPYVPTITGAGTVTGVSFFYERKGEDLVVSGGFTSGTASGSVFSISLPSGLTIDSTKFAQNNTTSNPGNQVGFFSGFGGGGSGSITTATATNAALVYAGEGWQNVSAVNALTPVNGNQILDNNNYYGVSFSVPIVGWIGTTAPILVNGVSSTSLGNLHLEYATVISTCTTSTCTLATSTPGISSITRSGTGTYTANFLASTFNSTPSCTVASLQVGAHNSFASLNGAGSTSAQAFEILYYASGPTATTLDDGFSIICTGTH
jgi:hypothetical protein